MVAVPTQTALRAALYSMTLNAVAPVAMGVPTVETGAVSSLATRWSAARPPHPLCTHPRLRVRMPYQLNKVGVTFWLTRNIPFGTNCGNAHRALLAVLIVIVVGGVVMPLYYKHVQRDLVRKDLRRHEQEDTDGTSSFESPYITRNRTRKRSVLASARFSVALKLAAFILALVVGLGYYYLWSKENRCTDTDLWIVKGWFIALLLVAVLVTAFMLSAMFRAVKERHRLNTQRYQIERSATNELDDLESSKRRSVPEPTLSSAPASPPPVYMYSKPQESSSHSTPQTPTYHVSDQRELHQIEVAVAEQLEQQQRHQQQMSYSQTPYGASGTGAYC
ncbi:hypothetical protein BGZ65_004432 [Modicella reniformis]|uniref:Transmembrane protein n=1 Tax=Modicella reniformis TaxID=1440133 RepID=A0A9P6LRR9_9FUNG|nr:hypothetical protein BGZ65_004432 [Modicella reniformis]